MKRRLALAAALLAALIGVAGAGAFATSTSVNLYAPFNGGGIAASVHVSKTVSGSCWMASLADARDDAFRCMVGNYIYDPCFTNETITTSYVLCPRYAPASPVMKINLTKPLPKSNPTGDPTRYAPWVIQLSDGRWCEILTGATGLIAGMRINYGCTGGAILIGNPHRSSSTWTIFAAKSFNASSYSSVAIRAAWW